MRKLLAVSAAAVGVTAATVALQVGPALAGHTNALLETTLDGRSEVATGATSNRIVGDPDGTGEAYVFGVDGDPETLCYVLTVDRIGTATAAHIHEGAAGENGPAVARLAAPGDGNAADCLTEGETDGVGAKFAPDASVADILANPEDYYVNVHNEQYPGGALRGQLAFQD